MAEHWPTERMILEGNRMDVATFEDLDDLDPNVLADIAALCEASVFLPDECIPCRANIMLMEGDRYHNPEEEDDAPTPNPRLTALLNAPDPFYDPVSTVPVVERFSQQVAILQNLVEELLEGPPIPPPDVTLEELAALVVGASKWTTMIDAQGLELAPNQLAMKQEIERVVEKVRRG